MHANPKLLLRGVAASAPIDKALTTQRYEVKYSDADVFAWRPDLVFPPPPGGNLLEAEVVYQTDEFGFRNTPPLPAQVDVAVLGRSTSQGAQAASSWPQLLAQQIDIQVLNLAQPSIGIHLRHKYLKDYALPRRPRWVIFEVIPKIDIVGTPASDRDGWILTRRLLPVLARSLLLPLWQPPAASLDRAIYPLSIDLPNGSFDLVCCLHYLEFYSVDRQTLEHSLDWAIYRQALDAILAEARAQETCVALFFAPKKPDIYFALATDPPQLAPVLRDYGSLKIDKQGRLVLDASQQPGIETILNNLSAGRELVRAYAHENRLPLIDPSEAFTQAVLRGADPFMRYDSHWNQLGHQLIADVAAQVLGAEKCE
ncbi:hypothetical protein ACFLZW_02170 [Chloroflexota bacterium]